LDARRIASAWRHIWVLLVAGLITGTGQIVLHRLSSANGIGITEAISLHAGRLPTLDARFSTCAVPIREIFMKNY